MTRLLAALAACALCGQVFGADLSQRLDAIATGSIASHSNLGVQVVELKTGKVLYSRNPDHLFLPASNMKLFTTALALRKLGGDFHFTTRLLLDPSGDVLLEGSGDPSMSGRAYPYKKGPNPEPPLQAIENLAAQAVAHGLTHVAGNIVGDDRAFPWDPYPPSWTQDDAQNADGAPVSALVVADNAQTLIVRPGTTGSLASVAWQPEVEYFDVDNRVVTVAGKAESTVRAYRIPGTRQIVVTGTLGEGHAPASFAFAVDDPARFAAVALHEALARHGVAIDGHVEVQHRLLGEARPAPETSDSTKAQELAVRKSPPLIELLQVTDKVSQNLHAEISLRASSEEGTREGGLTALAELIKAAGGSRDDYRIDDGSGLSRNDLVTPRLVAKLLAYMYGGTHRDEYAALLPVGGEDGTLSNRLGGAGSAASSHIRAKTGTLARSVALSGYADSKTYGPVAFSILVNDFAAPSASVRAWVDKMALALVE